MNYYVCDYKTHLALFGPWSSAQVVQFINSADNPKQFCNMSRYLLAKEGVYPNGKAGNLALVRDVEAAQQRLAADLPKAGAKYERCPECGTFLRVVYDPNPAGG